MTKRNKLRLDVEELDVEAFATVGHEMKRGTVRGHDDQILSFGNPYGSVCGSSCSGPYICDCAPPDPPR